MYKKLIPGFLLIISALVLIGCNTKIPPEALQLSQQSLKFRQMQTRHFDVDETTVLSASAAVLQDLGYNIDESATELGVIVCSKHRDAKQAGQVFGSILVALLTGVATPVDDTQLIRVSLVSNPVHVDETSPDMPHRTAVRVTFQRIVTNTQGQVSRLEGIMEDQIYREFFEKLAQSLFLEAHEI
jgi:hypothetical protein